MRSNTGYDDRIKVYVNKCKTFLETDNLVEALNTLNDAYKYLDFEKGTVIIKLKEKIINGYWDKSYDLIDKGNTEKGFRYINIIIREAQDKEKINYLNKKINIIYKFNLKHEAIKILRCYFEKFLEDPKLYKNIEICKDIVAKSNDKALLNELKNMLKNNGIPICFAKISIKKFLNLNFIEKLFEKSVDCDSILIADQCLEYIISHKATDIINWKVLIKYYKLKNDKDKILRYYDSLLKRNPYSKEILLDKISYFKKIKSFDFASDYFRKYVVSYQSKCNIEKIIDFIDVFKDFYMSNYYGKDKDAWKENLGFIKNINFIMTYIYDRYQKEKTITEKYIKELVFKSAKNENKDLFNQGLDIVRRYYKFNNEDYLKLAYVFYTNCDVEGSIKYLDLIINKKDIDESSLKVALNKKINICVDLQEYKDTVKLCNEYLKIGFNYEIFKILVNAYIHLKQYEKCIEICDLTLEKNFDKITKEERSFIKNKKSICLKATGKYLSSIINFYKK